MYMPAHGQIEIDNISFGVVNMYGSGSGILNGTPPSVAVMNITQRAATMLRLNQPILTIWAPIF